MIGHKSKVVPLPVNPWVREARATLALAWPMIMTNLAQTAMTVTDVMMLGRYSPEALAAGTLGHNFYFLLVIFGLGLIGASSPMMASAVGRKLRYVRDVRRTTRQGLWLSAAITVPIWLILWNTEIIFLAMGQTPELSAGAATYMRTLQWAVLPFFGYVTLRSFISALERPRWAVVVAFICIGINALACWLLIFGNFGFPEMGIAGAGIATSVSSLFLFIGMILVVLLDRQFRRFQIFGRFWRADWPRFKAMIRLGLPIAGMLTFEVSLFNVAAFMIGLIDTVSLAAHAIAMQISSVCFMIPMGIGQAATVRVGQAYGAMDKIAISRAGWAAFIMGTGFMAFTAMFLFLAPHFLIGAFIAVDLPENAAILSMATTLLALAALFQIADGAQAVANGMLRGLHDTKIPMFYAAIGYWGIGMTTGVLLAFYGGYGAPGIWMGLCVGLTIVALLLLKRWLDRDRLIPFSH